MGWLVVAVLLTVLLTGWVTFTLTRLDRLHARVDAAQAALDAQLVRRVAALRHVVESGAVPHDSRRSYELTCEQALVADGDERQIAENAVGRAVLALAPTLTGTSSDELREAATRVLIARRFYNDAVRHTRALRGRRMPRVLRLAGHRDLPTFFDIDDTVPPSIAPVPTTPILPTPILPTPTSPTPTSPTSRGSA